jgi:hypothetical protein
MASVDKKEATLRQPLALLYQNHLHVRHGLYPNQSSEINTFFNRFIYRHEYLFLVWLLASRSKAGRREPQLVIPVTLCFPDHSESS